MKLSKEENTNTLSFYDIAKKLLSSSNVVTRQSLMVIKDVCQDRGVFCE
jgi:hypothetical protein